MNKNLIQLGIQRKIIPEEYLNENNLIEHLKAHIGSYLITFGPEETLKYLKWLGIKNILDTYPIIPSFITVKVVYLL